MLKTIVKLGMSPYMLQLLCLAAQFKYAFSAPPRHPVLDAETPRFYSAAYREIRLPFLRSTENRAATSASASPPATPAASPGASTSASASAALGSASASPTPSTSRLASPSLSASATPTLQASYSSSPSASSAVVTPNPSPCSQSIEISELLKNSYVRHATLVRRSVPMAVVKSMFEYALRRTSRCQCTHGDEGIKVDLGCVHEVFTDDGRWMTRRLDEILELDALSPDADKLFPRYEGNNMIPDVDELEKKAMADALESSLADIEKANETSWPGVMLPADEVLRYDKDHARACEEFSQRMDKNSLWVSATSLTSYVLGMVHQLVLLPRSIQTGKEMLDKHVQLVYLAARCKRVNGDRLRVPVVFLESIIKRTHLALKNSSIGTGGGIIGGFPALTRVHDIVDVSRQLFPVAIEQMSSMNSFGRGRVLWWNGTHIRADNLEDVMLANATGREYNELCNIRGEMQEKEVACGVGFTWRKRLREVGGEEEKCCSNGCIRYTGGEVKRSVMNEMCCEACNSLICNVEDLAQVIDAQSYGFEHSRESSVVNVW